MSGYISGPRPSEPYPPARTAGAGAAYAPTAHAPWGQGAPPGTAGPRWPEPVRHRGTSVWGVLAVVVVGFLTLVSIGQIVNITGAGPAVVGAIAALVPLAVVLLGIRWVDRWEPEPRLTLLFALLWGAGVATLVSLVLNTAVSMAVYASTGDVTTAEAVGAVISAPLVEESAKGLGVLLILLARRRFFDGPVDGIVYAATVGAGFAFVENILYFGESIDTLPAVFILRGIMSPFAHVIFTAAIGIALGLASRSRSRAAWVWAFPAGWAVAVVLHALWNGSAVAGTFLAVYGLVQVPLFVGIVLLVLWLRRQERRVIAARLGEYAVAGWFAPHEVTMLTSFPTRRRARAWAAGSGAGGAMKRFQHAATELAFARQRVATGRTDLRHAADERVLLERITATRREFVGAAAARPGRTRGRLSGVRDGPARVGAPIYRTHERGPPCQSSPPASPRARTRPHRSPAPHASSAGWRRCSRAASSWMSSPRSRRRSPRTPAPSPSWRSSGSRPTSAPRAASPG